MRGILAHRTFIVALALLTGLSFTAAARADSNLIVNGGFEADVVNTRQKWDIYSSLTGWNLSRGPSIEQQRGVGGWMPKSGSQFVELDADIDGPGGTMGLDDASASIFQDVTVTPGQSYLLTFSMSARPAVEDNTMEILWGGSTLDMITLSGIGATNTNWMDYSYVITAESENMRLEFGDRGVSDSVGTFLDNVSLVPIVPEPASVFLFASATALGVCRRRRVAR